MSIQDDHIFRLLAAKADEAFFIYAPANRHFEYLSPAFLKLLHLHNDELSNAPDQLLMFIHPEDRDYVQSQKAVLQSTGKIHAEFRIIAGDEPTYIQLNAYQLQHQQEIIVGWANDISNLKQNILYAEKINAHKNSMLEILAHDLKEPVGMINMMATAIKNNPVAAGNETLQGYTRTIQQLCESNIQLIRSLVQQEFLEAQEIDLRLERVDLVWAVRDVVQHYKVSESLVNKEFHFYSEATQLYIVMDTLKIIQAVNNLISNAIKFTADGGLIEVRLTDLGGMARISVSDNGIGIPLALRPDLYEPHSRAQRPGLRGEPGSGMGLSIIRTLVELHGGRLWLDADESGSTFHIELPKGG